MSEGVYDKVFRAFEKKSKNSVFLKFYFSPENEAVWQIDSLDFLLKEIDNLNINGVLKYQGLFMTPVQEDYEYNRDFFSNYGNYTGFNNDNDSCAFMFEGGEVNLRQMLDYRKQLNMKYTLSEIIHILLTISQIILNLHENSIAHQNLIPENIILVPENLITPITPPPLNLLISGTFLDKNNPPSLGLLTIKSPHQWSIS